MEQHLPNVPSYFLFKNVIGVQAASIIMVAIMKVPFFIFAMYTRDGFPAEKILYFMIRQKILVPGDRPYKSENVQTVR